MFRSVDSRMTRGSTPLAAEAQGRNGRFGWLRGHPAPEIIPAEVKG
jgi:hypothetical protein